MKSIIKIVAIALLFVTYVKAQSQQKIVVSEDAFIEGGESSNTAFGETTPKNLRIFKSLDDSKYSRITYLKFTMPKKMERLNTVELNIPLKVYKNEVDQNATFNLQVFAVENDKWNEFTITWDDALELGEMVGEIEVKQSLDDKNQWIKIKLNQEIINNKFDGNKDRNITLALLNYKFNKISAMAPSKEQSDKTASYLLIE